MAASLLGYWPGETAISAASEANQDEITLSGRRSIGHGLNGGRDTVAYRPRNSDNQGKQSDDIFFDAPEFSIAIPPFEPHLPAYDSASPFLTNVEDDDEWQKFQPPKELFDVPYGTPLEIESIIVASVERLQQELAEENSFHESTESERLREAYMVEQSNPAFGFTGETGRAESSPISTPQAQSSSTNVTNSLSKGEGPRLSDASIKTESSGDSGYVSAPADINPSKGRLGSIFRFSNPLRRSREKLDTIKRTSLHSKSSTESIRECVSCLEDFQCKDLIPLTCHSYCKPCFQTLIRTALSCEDHWPPKCCLTEIAPETILPNLSVKERNKYKQVLEERSVPAGQRIYCSKTSCAVWIPPKNIDKGISCAACSACRQKTCTSCRGEYHATGECPRDANLQATLQVASDEGWRRCYSCNALVEHNQGCMHMTCRCKAQFCYICGSRWRTCSCTDADLQRVLTAANTRRLATQASEVEAENRRRADLAAAAAAEAEAAEMREVLRMIELFEIEEAERLAQEEEELRQAAIASRQRHEEERILNVSKKYFELTNDMNFLHAIQRASMTERHEEQRKDLQHQKKVRVAMVTRHAMELHLAEAEANAKISDSQFRYDQDYASRLSKEREIEDKYVAQLTAYWEGRPRGAEKIIEGRDALKAAHAESYQRWDKVKRTQQQQISAMAKEEVTRVKNRHEVERAIKAGKLEGEESTMAAERKADAVWFDRVMRVRGQMLDEMEMQEYTLEQGEFD